jgi:membrane protease YdiL (CAAX protease family)
MMRVPLFGIGALWRRLPVLVQAIITGAAVATAGTLPWALLAGANLKHKSSFRGYLQRPIERRHGAVIAILVAGVLFGLTHFTHSEVTQSHCCRTTWLWRRSTVGWRISRIPPCRA